MGREKKERSVQVSMHKQALILGFIWLVHDESEERLTLSGEFFSLFFYFTFSGIFFKSRNLVWCFFFFSSTWLMDFFFFFFYSSVFSDFNICLVFFFFSFFSFWFGRGGACNIFYFLFSLLFFFLPYYSSGTGMGGRGAGMGKRRSTAW